MLKILDMQNGPGTEVHLLNDHEIGESQPGVNIWFGMETDASLGARPGSELSESSVRAQQ